MSEPLRVLLIDDSPTDAKIVALELAKMGRPLEMERVDTAAGLREALTRGWDIAICDWSMPSFSAPLALQVIKDSGIDLPLIIVSGTVGEEPAVEAMRAGARDFVSKDRLGRLNAAIEREVREHAERDARRKAEAALLASETRFTRLGDTGIIGILIGEPTGRVSTANDALLKMLGYSRGELEAGLLNWQSSTPPEWGALDAILLDQLARTGVAGPAEKEYFNKDGRRVPVLIGVASLDGPTCISFVVDLTEKKNAVAEAARLVEEARREHAGRERAEEALRASEEQLRQSQKMEAVGRLAGGVAHDFNNLLSVILGYLEMVLEELAADHPMREALEQVQKASNRAAGLTRQLLLFSRQQVPEPKVIDLNNVLVGMERMLQRLVGEDVEMRAQRAASLWRVRVDPGHFEQVILNLVVNARDAMPTGGSITLETSNVELAGTLPSAIVPNEAGCYVMVAVTDTGVGFDAATQARMFEPFFTTKALGQGTGLGLSTVFGIVQQAGGTIAAESQPGHGATFRVYLPRVETPSAVERPVHAALSTRGTETILIVEDEEMVRTILQDILKRYGYRVIAAESAFEALRICEQRADAVDLVLTDVVMPNMSGPELARRLAASRPDLRIVFMSGYTDDSMIRHGVLESGVAFLHKPLTPVAVTRKIREVLDRPPVVFGTRVKT